MYKLKWNYRTINEVVYRNNPSPCYFPRLGKSVRMYGRRNTGKKNIIIIRNRAFHFLQYGLSSWRESFEFRKAPILNASSDLKKKKKQLNFRRRRGRRRWRGHWNGGTRYRGRWRQRWNARRKWLVTRWCCIFERGCDKRLVFYLNKLNKNKIKYKMYTFLYLYLINGL